LPLPGSEKSLPANFLAVASVIRGRCARAKRSMILMPPLALPEEFTEMTSHARILGKTLRPMPRSSWPELRVRLAERAEGPRMSKCSPGHEPRGPARRCSLTSRIGVGAAHRRQPPTQLPRSVRGRGKTLGKGFYDADYMRTEARKCR